MKVVYTKQFLKEISQITDKKLGSLVEVAILEVKSAFNPSQIRNFKKLKRHKFAYRIRVGDYRIGIYLNNDIIEFSRFLHRKEIYRYFP